MSQARQRSEDLARRLTATPLIPVIIAVVLGLFQGGKLSLWLDEAYSSSLAQMPLRMLADNLINRELHASPYYLSLHFWQWLGDSEAWLRALSVVYGAIAVAVLFYVARRFSVAFPASLILAVTPFFIEFEQEARAYTMLVAAAVVSMWLFLRLIEQPGWLRAVLYVAVGALLIYVHPLGALVVVAQGVGLILFVSGPQKWRLAAVYIPIGILWIPMVLFAIRRHDVIGWIPPTTLDLVGQYLLILAGGTFLLGMVLVMLAIGWRRDMTAVWLLVPLLGTLAISFLVQPALQPKYLIALLPAAAIILARNRPVVIATLLVVSLLGVGNWYVNGIKADWRSAGAWVEQDVQPGDGIVFEPNYLRIAFGYYARVADPVDAAVPWSANDLSGGRPDIPAILASRRIWLVQGYIADADVPPDVQTALDQFTVLEKRLFGGNQVSITLLEKTPQPP